MKSFLIVEDNDYMRKLYEILVSSRYKHSIIDSASNGKEALEKAVKTDYSVILSDIDMPVMDGIAFYKVLKEKRPSMATKVVYLSASTDEADLNYLKLEGKYILSKPFNIKEFHGIIKVILETRNEGGVLENCTDESRHYNRFKIRKKCTLLPLDSALTSFGDFSAETIDYSESGLGLSYEGEELPSGTTIRVFCNEIESLKEKGNVIWSYCLESHSFRTGIEWTNP